MKFMPFLLQARLIRRYKRFLADVILSDGSEITVHCPNTGSMKNCIVEGSNCWLLPSDNNQRKYRYTLQIATTPTGHLACVNTHVANTLIAEALAADRITEVRGYNQHRAEVSFGKRSRVDFVLTAENRADCYLEVKSVTLLDGDQGYFPDAISLRANKHVRELMAMVVEGKRAVLLFCVLHNGITSVAAASHIDPEYAVLLRQAQDLGVELLAYATRVSPEEIIMTHSVPVVL
jgi:sugar fermentation stimulation protein A